MTETDDLNNETVANNSVEPARFLIRLALPEPQKSSLSDASEAVRREYRDSVKWKRMRCRSVKFLSKAEAGFLYILEVGHSVEFDWSWEGAVAFRPLHLVEFADVPKALFDTGTDDIEIEDSILWTGEILEVDESTGRIFVCVSNADHPPTTGSFYVRPFEFLATLNAVYNEPAFDLIRTLLPARLFATEGNIHPDVEIYNPVGMEELKQWWGKCWSVLWGPPGTGKTYTTGQQVARVLADPSERILVVSTTNRATDASAIAIGKASGQFALKDLSLGKLLRIGKGASLKTFADEDLTVMLKGTETELLAQIEELSLELSRMLLPEDKAVARSRIRRLRKQVQDVAKRNFLDRNIRVNISTAFRATTFLKHAEVKKSIEQGFAPFTTVFIDEAGLLSRVSIAAISLLASRRVVLVGDPKQLAPISRISRILPTNQMTWLANSSLSHLDTISSAKLGVHVLREQRRMHSDICKVVSAYQYENILTTAQEVQSRDCRLPEIFRGQPRAIWYVLDEDGEDLPTIRAERGPGNKSWIRVATAKILARLFSDDSLRAAQGLFVSPFRAQAKQVAAFFAKSNLATWSASTVHSQQGSEADIVIFDTVNAGSYSWPYDEWKRLVNVAISRSRETIIVLASRAEMEEPYLRPLLKHLQPRVLRKKSGKLSGVLTWDEIPARLDYKPPNKTQSGNPNSIGVQISKRKEMRPVLSHEQQRLCGFKLDGNPRLVRGVAGSGKTVVLAHWVMTTVKQLGDKSDARIWAVFANRSLQSLISNSIATAWENEIENAGKPFPWDRVVLRHVKEVLTDLLPEAGLSMARFAFEYDVAAAAYLDVKPVADIQPRCDALFIDEAQDMGPNTLKLLSALVKQTNADDANSRSVNIFYDNAQNIYGRGTPVWAELGLDMRGRSTVMKESFRSTTPITEFALNVLYRLKPPESNADHKEMVSRGLIEKNKRNGVDWWSVQFNQINGPKPTFHQYTSLDLEFAAIAEYCCKLIQQDRVQPGDICLIYNGPYVKTRIETTIAPRLASIGVEVSIQTNRPFSRSSKMLLASTSHSFKGYDAEVVIIPAADQYVAKDVGILANNLYVAMTRARSILTIFSESKGSSDANKLYKILNDCLDMLHERPQVDTETHPQSELMDLLDIIGLEHRKWLMELWGKHPIIQEPIVTKTGEIVAQPLFWINAGNINYACFGKELPGQRALERMVDLGIRILKIGENI